MPKRVLILTDSIGRRDDELGRVLMRNFIYSVARDATSPAAVMLMHDGVRLACTGSEVLDDLGLMVGQGIPVKVCGTCLDYLGLKDDLVVGEVGTMPDGVAAMLADDAVVTIA